MLAETQIKQKANTSVRFLTDTDAITLGSERPNFHFNEMSHKRNEDEVHHKKDRRAVDRGVSGGGVEKSDVQ